MVSTTLDTSELGSSLEVEFRLVDRLIDGVSGYETSIGLDSSTLLVTAMEVVHMLLCVSIVLVF